MVPDRSGWIRLFVVWYNAACSPPPLNSSFTQLDPTSFSPAAQPSSARSNCIKRERKGHLNLVSFASLRYHSASLGKQRREETAGIEMRETTITIFALLAPVAVVKQAGPREVASGRTGPGACQVEAGLRASFLGKARPPGCEV